MKKICLLVGLILFSTTSLTPKAAGAADVEVTGPIVIGQPYPSAIGRICDTLGQVRSIVTTMIDYGYSAGIEVFRVYSNERNERGDIICGYVKGEATPLEKYGTYAVMVRGQRKYATLVKLRVVTQKGWIIDGFSYFYNPVIDEHLTSDPSLEL
jgi:hypothetical protein